MNLPQQSGGSAGPIAGASRLVRAVVTLAPLVVALAPVTAWLRSHGFTIDEVAAGRTTINFSGSVDQVEKAFHTQIKDFHIEGAVRHANVSDPSIPRALAGLVSGVVSMHNIPRKAM